MQALVAELEHLEQQGVFAKQKLEAVFFGGGTPSVLSPQQINAILQKIHSVAKLTEDCELTFESSIYDLGYYICFAVFDGLLRNIPETC